MRAVAIPRFGSPEVLEQYNLPEPQPKPGEIAVEVNFAGVNFAEVLYRRGVLPDIPLPFVPGIEVAGVVRTLGDGVTGFNIGEQVAALTIVYSGGYGEVVVADARLVVPLEKLPGSLSLEVAAAAPSNLTTAHLLLSRVARLESGQTVLVHAAAGGVGSALGQMARALGAGRVYGTVGSQGKLKYARSLGYDEVFLHDTFEPVVLEATDGEGVDVVCDQVGGAARLASLRVLRPLGRLVVMGNASNAEDVAYSANGLWFSSKAVAGFNLAQLSAVVPDRVGTSLRAAFDLLARGDVRVDVTDTLPLTSASEAHRRLESRETTGKLVLRVKDE